MTVVIRHLQRRIRCPQVGGTWLCPRQRLHHSAVLQQLLLASLSVTVPAIFQLFQDECWGQGDAINTGNETCKLLPLSNPVIVETYAQATAASWIASDLSAATALLMARNCNESRSTSRVERACSKLCKQVMHSLRCNPNCLSTISKL